MTTDHDVADDNLERLNELTDNLLDPIDATPGTIAPDEIADLVAREPAAAQLLAQLNAAQAYARVLREERDSGTPLAQAPVYRDWIDSDEWRTMADACILRAGGACQVCKSSRDLQVHHNTYVRFGGRELDTDLVALCAGCHTIFHLARNLTDKLA